MAERGFGVTRPNLPHWATAMGGWGVRSGRVFGWGVKSGLTGLNGGCQGAGRFLRDIWPMPTNGGALSAFGELSCLFHRTFSPQHR